MREPLQFEGGLAIDVDGANGDPAAYNLTDHLGLDALANAGHPGDWFGLVTDDGLRTGKPVNMGGGRLLSGTTLRDRTKSRLDPTCYVDPLRFNSVCMPPELRGCAVDLGDLAVGVNRRQAGHPPAFAIVSDLEPRGHLGEGSPRFARGLAVNPSPRWGGTSSGIVLLFFPDSATDPPWPRTQEDIDRAGAALFAAWGGVDRLLGDQA